MGERLLSDSDDSDSETELFHTSPFSGSVRHKAATEVSLSQAPKTRLISSGSYRHLSLLFLSGDFLTGPSPVDLNP